MPSHRTSAAVLVLPLLFAGCATLAPGPKTVASTSHGTYTEGTYTLAKDELAYDCTKLTGHMKIRISSMIGALNSVRTSAVSRTTQSLMAFGSDPGRGVDANADRQADRAYLEAYNRQLVAKGCTPFNIDAELNGQPTPNAGRPVAGKSNTSAKPAAVGKS